MGATMGFECKLLLNEEDFGDPDWQPIGIIKDAKVVANQEKAPGTTRGDPVETYALKKPDIVISCKLKVDTANLHYQAIRDARINRTDLDLWAASGEVTAAGSEGPRGDFKVTKWERAEPDGDVVFMDVEFAPSGTSSNPFEDWKESEDP